MGYRESLRMEAERAGCTGWVRNCGDGSVEAVIQGPAQAVERVVAWARRGPPAARVERVDTVEAGGSYAQFEVLRTL